MNAEPKNPKVLSLEGLVGQVSNCSPVHTFEEGKSGRKRVQINSPDNIRESDLDGVIHHFVPNLKQSFIKY